MGIRNVLDEIKGNPPVQSRIGMTSIIMSDCIYLWYLYKSVNKYIKTKDIKFLFTSVASLFAFLNNLNDIVSFLFSANSDCKKFFYVFIATATLNWTPISWLQTIRLMSITKVFYTRKTYKTISCITILLSLIYTASYYLNLTNYDYENISKQTDYFMYCTVKQQKYINGTVEKDKYYTLYVMISDIVDSAFSFGILVLTTSMALENIKHLQFHHAKIKRMVEEGLFQFIVLTISKILIYPIIIYSTQNNLMIYDITWDFLSVIVIICSFRMVNVKYKRVKIFDDDPYMQ
ncbi:hypothetical protein BCR32DRAFT_328299 [Anaeromyces robustus]|uniref:G-protein coupled receptors family 1 profile domain-containing protein n=1 Tax=Anaeromyces robustus TaxID=1754192 RepID=A0A1Y1X133_9FUNG|nr:hypothetical protein BCR32DRAFT_328299 [Anaeromyces robustus]|eukprot:ORX79044.1 hypothetical protein BCR32DRAFT_328299 [Anaeromyces robustus]